MGTTNLQVYTIIYGSGGLKDVADAIDTKYLGEACTGAISTLVTSIKSTLDAIWVVSLYLCDDKMRDGLFTSGGLCGLAGMALTDSDAAMGKLLEGVSGISQATMLDSHIVDHLDTILAASIDCSIATTNLTHVETDLLSIKADLDIFKLAFNSLEGMLNRINRALAMFSFSLGCASTIIDQLANSNNILLYNQLGLGSGGDAASASLTSKALQSVQDYRSESDLSTRLGFMKGDIQEWEVVPVSGTISASSGDNSFNDSANGFDIGLYAGQSIKTSGFANGALNGVFTILDGSSPTVSKIIVEETLATEVAGASVTIVAGGEHDSTGIKDRSTSSYASMVTVTPF